jgi:hypothetical protein
VTAATVEAVVLTDGIERSVRLEYSHAPALPEVVFEVLQAGTPPEVCGLGKAVERRIVWSLTEAQQSVPRSRQNSHPSPLCEGGADVVPPEPGEGSPSN